MGSRVSLSSEDAARFPVLSAAGQAMLRHMTEHPAAPIYRNASGHRLREEDIPTLRQYGLELARTAVDWRINAPPGWLLEHIAQIYQEVPHYRQQGRAPARWSDIEPVSRAAFSRDIASFVPDSVPAEGLINFRTTGTTGHPLLIASHPTVAAKYMFFHQRALHRLGIELTHGRGQVGVVLLGFQSKCFTYVSVTPLMDESGLAKINLHPNDWHGLEHRQQYLEAMNPEIIMGDPISFAELLKISPRNRPRALISVAMTLMPGLRAQLERYFGCPVLDVYSMNEVGPIGVWDSHENGFVMLQPKLYVEILNRQGQVLPSGEVGEITVSGGFNFCLPLLRYRTGDYGALAAGKEGPILTQFVGRQPIRYCNSTGQWFNNIDISHALAPLAISHYQLHQREDGALTLCLPAQDQQSCAAVRDALRPLFADQYIDIAMINEEDKVKQYTSELPGAIE
jgi:phenylacetate-CoA ligase